MEKIMNNTDQTVCECCGEMLPERPLYLDDFCSDECQIAIMGKKPTINQIKVYCGDNIPENGLFYPTLPLYRQIEKVKEVIIEFKKIRQENKGLDIYIYTHIPNVVRAFKQISEYQKVTCEFFLNTESQGSNINGIFRYFNKSLELIDNYSGCKP